MKKLKIKSDLPDKAEFITDALFDIYLKINEIVDWIEHHEAKVDHLIDEFEQHTNRIYPNVHSTHEEPQPTDEEQDEIQEDTTSMEEKLEAVNELDVNRCSLGVNSDVQPIGCKHEGYESIENFIIADFQTWNGKPVYVITKERLDEFINQRR